MEPDAAVETPGLARIAAWTEGLAGSIGPRQPCSSAERAAAEWLRRELADAGLRARLEPFPAHRTFATSFAAAPLTALAAAGAEAIGLARTSAVLGGAALLLAAAEDDLRLRPLTRLLARRSSQNLVAAVDPRGESRRTLCLVSHIDSSRSGLLFHPAVAARIRPLLALTAAALGLQALGQVLRRRRAGRVAVAAARVWLAAGLALLAERELRGEDVPGANDNASGAALTAALAAEVAAAPLESTRLVLLVSGAEEAGTLGADAFLRSHDTSGWLFLNFDGVGARATLRYLPREGLLRTFAADPGLLRAARIVADARPDLRLEPADRLVGLTYDATQVMATGGRALTVSAQDDAIPNYHQPTDDPANVSSEVLGRAAEVGRELIRAIDRGDAD